MSLIERLKAFDTADYRYYGWGLMVLGKLADLGTTWYALTYLHMFVEGNPVPAIALEQYGILGLVLLNGLAIMTITIAVEIGTELMRRHGASERARQLVVVLGYWLPGLFWLFISYSNYKAVRQAQAVFGF